MRPEWIPDRFERIGAFYLRYVKDNVNGIEHLIALIGLPFANKLIKLFIRVMSTPNDNDITRSAFSFTVAKSGGIDSRRNWKSFRRVESRRRSLLCRSLRIEAAGSNDLFVIGYDLSTIDRRGWTADTQSNPVLDPGAAKRGHSDSFEQSDVLATVAIVGAAIVLHDRISVNWNAIRVIWFAALTVTDVHALRSIGYAHTRILCEIGKKLTSCLIYLAREISGFCAGTFARDRC